MKVEGHAIDCTSVCPNITRTPQNTAISAHTSCERVAIIIKLCIFVCLVHVILHIYRVCRLSGEATLSLVYVK